MSDNLDRMIALSKKQGQLEVVCWLNELLLAKPNISAMTIFDKLNKRF